MILNFLKNNKEKIFTKDTFYIVIILILLILFLLKGCDGNNKDNQNEALIKELLKLDKTVQETNGAYRKLVNNFATQNELNTELKSINEELYKTVKKNDEKLLMIAKTVATFENKIDKGINVTITNNGDQKIIEFVTRYPTNEPGKDWFIEYKGRTYTQVTDSKELIVDSTTGNWNFNKLEFNVILTEQENGIWAYRLDGPEFLKVDSIQVNARPKEQFNPNGKKINLLVGAGYRTLLDLQSGALTLNGGMEFKQKNMILLDVSSNKMIGLTFIRKL